MTITARSTTAEPFAAPTRASRGTLLDEKKPGAAELAQTQKLAELGLMTSAILHELKQPLMGIKGFAQLLQASADPAAADKSAQILAQVDRMEALIASHRRFLHSNPNERTRVDLRSLAQEAVRLVDAKAHQAGAKLAYHDPGKPMLVEAAPSQLLQILTNLLTNAIDAVQAAGRKHVGLHLRDNVGIELLVSDEGVGLSAEAIPKLFSPFFTTKGPETGTGLGLYISRALAQANGATLEPMQPRDAGLEAKTVFRLRFAAKAPQPAAKPAKKAVLVVDDEEVVRTLLSDLLAPDGLELVLAETGDQALEILKSRSFDLVLTDKNLPGATGLEIAKAVRERSRTCPVMLMTGYPSLETAQEALSIGLIDYLEKPFDDIGAVRRRVRDVLAGPQAPVVKAATKRVLVVEDRSGDSLQLAESVQLAGGIAQMATTVQQALALLASDGAAGVILSLDLKDRELTPENIRTLKRGTQGPLITLCDKPSLEQTVAAIRMGAAVCLPRALASPQALSRELNKLLRW